MKALFLAIPGTGLYLSTLPLAWAFRAAGHEVLLINNGEATQRTAQAGLPAIECCPGSDLWGQFMDRAKDNRVMGTAPPVKPPPGFWGWFGEHMAEGALRAARAFAPDLIVSTLEQGAGPLLAAALNCPIIEQNVRLGWGGVDPRAKATRDSVAEYLLPTKQRLGITSASPEPLAYLDLRSPRLGGRGSAETWLMQPVPYNGGKVLPQWVVERPDVPRLVLTLGSVLPVLRGLADCKDLVASLAELEVELVLALGNFDLTALGPLPANVRNAGWMPLSALMPTTQAIIHHGGAATCFTPFFYGVPQLVLPKGADQPDNAKVVEASGVGLSLSPDLSSAEDVCDAAQRLLSDGSFRSTARQVQQDLHALPSPAQIVSRIERLLA